MGQLAQAAMAQYGETLKSPEARFGPASARIPRGVLPEALLPPLEAVLAHSTGLLDVLRAIAKALRSTIKETPDEAPRLAALYAQLGSLAPRLEAVFATTELLLHTPAPGQAPAAKWFTLEMDGEWIALQAHASPILPGSTLRQHLWSQVRGGVLTSATLTSCGSFDFFLREVGLHDLPTLATLEVASPFDYPSQGVLWAHHTQADPKHAGPFTQEMVHTLLHDLASVQTGALVLFTSKEQMRQAVDALPSALRSKVLVQNTMPRFALLNKHREQVEAGQASIIFGMQSFGEGLDLPGALSASLFITKLPFAPPDDPLVQARTHQLEGLGLNAFNDYLLPEAAMALKQGVGRLIRSETDQGMVVVGRSLGSGIALQVAATRRAERLVLVTPYASIAELAAAQFPLFPVGLLLQDRYESWRYAPRIKVPTTVIVADRDEVIPNASSRRLAECFVPGIATVVNFPDAGHNDVSDAPGYPAALAGSGPATTE